MHGAESFKILRQCLLNVTLYHLNLFHLK